MLTLMIVEDTGSMAAWMLVCPAPVESIVWHMDNNGNRSKFKVDYRMCIVTASRI